MYLFFDTETTGLPKKYNAPISDLENWPRIVQLAWQIYDKDGNLVDSQDKIIKPEGFLIPAESTAVHRISHEQAEKEGLDLKEVLEEFSRAVDKSESLIAHNFSFDEKIVLAEFLRKYVYNNFGVKTKICTMLSTVDFCAISKYNNASYKWPKLSELYQALFSEDFEDAHNAMVDVEATAKCFFELKKRGII